MPTELQPDEISSKTTTKLWFLMDDMKQATVPEKQSAERQRITREQRLRRVGILGVGVHDCDEDGAVDVIKGFLREETRGVRQVATVNPEFIMEARHNRPFRDLLNSSDLATPDGV